MDRRELVAAILSGKKENIEQALPPVIVISHTIIEKAFNYLCENDMPIGSAYWWMPRTNKEDLPRVLQVFDVFFINVCRKVKTEPLLPEPEDKETWDLFHRVMNVIKDHYDLVEPGHGNEKLFEPPYGQIMYKPYKAEN